ncbi:hypothetical protein F4141_11895 [Candidatus Poribacteria bacterium]|nr:hypothetical protein [Candidatus Poribacteria bacterium]
MPIFRVEEDTLIIAQETNVELEQHIEIWIENSPWAVIQGELVLWIDRQASAQDEEGTIYPDLLGVDSEGDLVVVEFKRRQTPRDVVAQLLEYAAWANELPLEQIHEIADAYFEKRDEFRGKTFPDAFREVFDIPETDELPPLNRKLRLFVVAEEIHPRVARVCRFLRTSYKMDVSCIVVSKFQTESGDEIVSTETEIGNEDFSSPALLDYPPLREVVLEVVEELTHGNTDTEFTPIKVKRRALEKYPGIRVAAVPFNIRIYTVNQSAFHNIPIEERRYWCLRHGVYRLYDPEKDKLDGDEHTDQVE